MVFAIDMELLREHPFASVKGEPGEIRKGGYRFEAYFRLDPAADTVQVDIREAGKTPKKGRAKAPAQVPPLKPGEVADEGLFRKSLRDMEENNRRFFGGRKGD